MAQVIKEDVHPIYFQIQALIEAYHLLIVSNDIADAKVKLFRRKKRALYRSSIITICASWESFLEAAVEAAIKHMITYLDDPNKTPNNLKARISERLIASKNPIEIWKISGENWQSQLRLNYEILIDGFNTPRPTQVDDFIFKTLGLREVSKKWAWRGQSAAVTCKKLNEFMDLRGDIVHRVFPNRNIHSATIAGYINLLYRIACITANELREHVHHLTGKHPWGKKKVENIVD